MRAIYVKLFFIVSISSLLFANECKEISKELKKLQELKTVVEAKIAKNKKLLQEIKAQKKALQDLNATIEKQIAQIESQRFKKLAKDFEGMDPEYAGEKLSKIEDPKIAAYILYNMNSRKAGEALNYVAPESLSKIVKILTQLKKHEKK
ncbi:MULTISPECIES: hypothetical protein [unclassified Nitratiruptor]|uniref:hypothetical protein n=1 Tax=unclassified Nitratiruptor TaxID=2624044 RepID=UPI001915B643|nr:MULTISPECIES: hypothetical protein [unclassified Nitratiruptor]